MGLLDDSFYRWADFVLQKISNSLTWVLSILKMILLFAQDQFSVKYVGEVFTFCVKRTIHCKWKVQPVMLLDQWANFSDRGQKPNFCQSKGQIQIYFKTNLCKSLQNTTGLPQGRGKTEWSSQYICIWNAIQMTISYVHIPSLLTCCVDLKYCKDLAGQMKGLGRPNSVSGL